MTPVSHGKPCAGNPHARFDEGASASEKPRRNALLHNLCDLCVLCGKNRKGGAGMLSKLARILRSRAGRGYSHPNLNNMRKFYLLYPNFQTSEKSPSQVRLSDDELRIDVRIEDKKVWLNQSQLSVLFGVTIPTVNYHIKEILNCGELAAEATIGKILIVRPEGARTVRRPVDFNHKEHRGHKGRDGENTGRRKEEDSLCVTLCPLWPRRGAA